MDFRQVRYFLEVAEARSFSRASARVRITQPALSRQIIQLEDELGVRLLVRHGRGVQLTESGAIFRDKARVILKQFEQLAEQVRDHSGTLAGEVMLGIPPTLGPVLAKPLIQRFATNHPDVFLRFHVATSENIRDQVIRGDLDLGVILATEDPGPLLCEPLLTERMYLVGNEKDWPDNLSPIEALSQSPLLLTTAPNGIRRLVEQFATAHGIDLRVRAEMNSMSLMMSAIISGIGFSVLPRCTLVEVPGNIGLRAEPLPDLDVAWVLSSSKERFQSHACLHLKQMIMEEAAAHAKTEMRL